MNRKTYRNIIAAACIATGMYACSDMEEYKDLYLKGGEISYTGKLDSVKVYSGHERVMLEGLFMADPKVTGCIIYWNNGEDSLDVPIERTDGVDTLRQIINLPENLYNFELYTYDQYGNRSVAVYASGESYGPNFISQLTNRPLRGETVADASGLTLNFLPVDQTLGPVCTVLAYTNTEGKEDTVHVDVQESSKVIEDYKKGTTVEYYTQYVPDTLCIDTFDTERTQVMPLNKIESISVLGFSSEEPTGENNGQNGKAIHVIDNNVDTYWHSQWQAAHPDFPHYLSFDLATVHNVKAIALTPRQNVDNMVKDFEVYSSADGDEWDLIGSFTKVLAQNAIQYFELPQSVDTRYVKIVLLNSYSTDPHTALAEIAVYE